MQDRILGVYAASSINSTADKSLLSVLDGQLTNASSAPLIDIDAIDSTQTIDKAQTTKVNVGTGVLIRASSLDAKLIAASAPLIALTNASMSTSTGRNLVDIVGTNGKLAELQLMNNSLAALNASTMLVRGNLLNLNAATATLGYLFSLNNTSSLTINGSLFSLSNGSVLNLTANAFGVFGSGNNTLSINNSLCSAACGLLVNSANQPILINNSPLKVAGATQNVVLPNGFNVFNVANGAPQPQITIPQTAALFEVKNSTVNIVQTTGTTSIVKK
jgi:hypothetical protein